LDEDAVPSGLHDPTMAARNGRVGEFLADGLQRPQGPHLVSAHQPAIADHIAGEDRGKPSLNGRLLCHGRRPHRSCLSLSRAGAETSCSLPLRNFEFERCSRQPFLSANREHFVQLAAEHRLPAIYEWGEYVRSGCLMAYGPAFAAMARRAATFVDKILKG